MKTGVHFALILGINDSLETVAVSHLLSAWSHHGSTNHPYISFAWKLCSHPLPSPVNVDMSAYTAFQL